MISKIGLALKTTRGDKKRETLALKERIIEIVSESAPLSCRNLYYQLLTGNPSVPKTEKAYDRILRLKRALCMAGEIDWLDFTDNARTYYRNQGWNGIADPEFQRQAESLYSRDMWTPMAITPQLWCEADSMVPTLSPVAEAYGVNLYPSRGMPSDSFVATTASAIVQGGRPNVLIAYVGDFDPAGQTIADNVKAKLLYHMTQMAGQIGIDPPQLIFVKLAITERQITDYRLPTKPVKATQSRKRYDISESVEAEAMRPADMRGIVRAFFRHYLPDHVLQAQQSIQASERMDWLSRVRGTTS